LGYIRHSPQDGTVYNTQAGLNKTVHRTPTVPSHLEFSPSTEIAAPPAMGSLLPQRKRPQARSTSHAAQPAPIDAPTQTARHAMMPPPSAHAHLLTPGLLRPWPPHTGRRSPLTRLQRCMMASGLGHMHARRWLAHDQPQHRAASSNVAQGTQPQALRLPQTTARHTLHPHPHQQGTTGRAEEARVRTHNN